MFAITHSANRNKTRKRAVGVEVGGSEERGEELDKIWKMRGKQYRKVFIK